MCAEAMHVYVREDLKICSLAIVLSFEYYFESPPEIGQEVEAPARVSFPLAPSWL